MYCAIQELQLKRPNTNGAYKQLAVFTNPFNPRRDALQYGYCYTGDQFERPIRTTYKISIHESKRVNGVVTKKQFVVTTVDYYTFATDWFALGDYAEKIVIIADKLNVDYQIIYDTIKAKISPLQEHIGSEFKKTEEYIASTKHNEIIALYKKEIAKFSKKYGCSELEYEYDYCFNVFGELMNENYYERIVSDAKLRRSYQGLTVQ
jgi:hypothetical protein